MFKAAFTVRIYINKCDIQILKQAMVFRCVHYSDPVLVYIFNTVYIKYEEVVIGCEHDLHSHSNRIICVFTEGLVYILKGYEKDH